jgi:AcrR family transcriptional regulator
VSAHRERPQAAPAGDAVRDRIAAAMVHLAGAHGYEATTIDALCARAEVPRDAFDRRFASVEECFLYAYDGVSTEFGERVLGAYETQIAWHDKVWAAGWAAIGFLREDPVRARFFAVEVSGAGNRARQRRDRIMQIFADLVDAGRAELDEPDELSRATAEIVAGAIYFTIQNKILEGFIDRGEDFLVDLIYMAVLPYLGPDAAEAELRVHSLRGAH